jgi:hypothetical protein
MNTAHTSSPQPHQRTFKILLYILLALTLVRGFIYASLVPPWQAPDEPAQFERVRAALIEAEWNSTVANEPAWYDDLIKSLVTFGFWDFLDDNRKDHNLDLPLNRYITLYHEAYGGLYGSRLTFAVMGWPLFFALEQDITLQLYLVRLNMVVMAVGIIFLAYLTTKTIFPHDPFLIFGVPLLILFNPQHTHMLSTVNNGNLAELLATAALYFMVRGIIKGFSWPNFFIVVTLSLVAMWTKATTYFLPLTYGSISLFYLWQYRRKWPWLLPFGFLLLGATYFLAPQRLRDLISLAITTLQQGGFYLDPVVPTDLFKSFWAMPGWTIFQLHPFWYQVLLTVCVLALVGLTLGLMTKRRHFFSKEFRLQRQALTILAVAAIVAISVILSWNTLTNSIVYRQGRSIYPVIMPLSLMLGLGWRQLIPSAGRKFGLLLISVALLLFDSLVLFNYIIPIFYSRYQ